MQTGKKGAHRLTSERHFSSCTVIRSLDRGATGDWHEDTAVTAWDGSGASEFRLLYSTDVADEGLIYEALLDPPQRQFEFSFAESVS